MEHYWALIIKKCITAANGIYWCLATDYQVLKESRGRHCEMSCDIFFYSFYQIDVDIANKNNTSCFLSHTVKQSQGHPYETSWDIIYNSFKQIDINISCINIVLYTLQAAICHPGPISQNESYPQVIKQSQGHPYETSWDIPIKRPVNIWVIFLLQVWLPYHHKSLLTTF